MGGQSLNAFSKSYSGIKADFEIRVLSDKTLFHLLLTWSLRRTVDIFF